MYEEGSVHRDEYSIRDILLAEECFENESMNTLPRDSLDNVPRCQEISDRFLNGEVSTFSQFSCIVKDSNTSMQKSNEILQTYIKTEN